MLARLVLSYPVQELRRLYAHFAIFVEEAQSKVEQSRMGLGRNGKEKANFVIGIDKAREAEIDFAGLRGCHALHTESVVQVVQVKTFERLYGVESGHVLCWRLVRVGVFLGQTTEDLPG